MRSRSPVGHALRPDDGGLPIGAALNVHLRPRSRAAGPTRRRAFRIAVEALNNVVRHAKASRAEVRLRWGETLDLEIVDDGSPNGAWRPGVGLQGMRERTDELGGRFHAGPSAAGGRVYASFPLATS